MSELLQIPIHVSRREGSNSPDHPQSMQDTNLALKIKDYVGLIGFANTSLLTIFLELLTKGKVVVDFQDYTERLEVPEVREIPPLESVVVILNQFIDELKKAAKKTSSKITQSIIAQSNFVKGKTTVVQAKINKHRLFEKKSYGS